MISLTNSHKPMLFLYHEMNSRTYFYFNKSFVINFVSIAFIIFINLKILINLNKFNNSNEKLVSGTNNPII